MRTVLTNFFHGLALFCVALVLLTNSAHADKAEKERQYKLEAAFLYNFFNYITWPGYDAPDQLATATICVIENDPIEPYLTYVQHKMSEQRQLVIKRLPANGKADGCNLVFARSTMPQSKLTTPMLTVSADSNSSTSMISMHAVNGRMALSINNSALSEQGFQTSSRLLSLAQEIR